MLTTLLSLVAKLIALSHRMQIQALMAQQASQFQQALPGQPQPWQVSLGLIPSCSTLMDRS